MDEKQKIAKQMGIDKPIMSLRHVGSRIELHLYGEASPRIIMRESEIVFEDGLESMRVGQLRSLVSDLGIVPGRMSKADLIAAIRESTG